MKTVTVNASRKYDILIDKNILSDTGALISNVHNVCTAVVISDTNVYPLYGNKLMESLTKNGFSVLSYVFPAGEESKNIENLSGILNFLA